MTSAPGGGAPVPTEVMRSSVITITAFGIGRPFGSIALPARMAFVAANAGAASRKRIETVAQPRLPDVLFILCSRFFDLAGDVARKRVGRDHACEGPEAQNPALERA